MPAAHYSAEFTYFLCIQTIAQLVTAEELYSKPTCRIMASGWVVRS